MFKMGETVKTRNLKALPGSLRNKIAYITFVYSDTEEVSAIVEKNCVPRRLSFDDLVPGGYKRDIDCVELPKKMVKCLGG